MFLLLIVYSYLAWFFLQLKELSWREDVKLIAHHSKLISEASLHSLNKQPAGYTNLPCFALLKLCWAQYGNSINNENDTGKCSQNCKQLFFLNIFLNHKLTKLSRIHVLPQGLVNLSLPSPLSRVPQHTSSKPHSSSNSSTAAPQSS